MSTMIASPHTPILDENVKLSRGRMFSLTMQATALGAMIYKQWKKDGSAATPQQTEKLREIGAQIGMRVDVFAHAQELLDAIEAIEDYANNQGDVKQALPIFAQRAPVITGMIVNDPEGIWLALEKVFTMVKVSEDRIRWIEDLYEEAVVNGKKYLPATQAAIHAGN